MAQAANERALVSKNLQTCRGELLKILADNPQNVFVFQLARSLDDVARKAGAAKVEP